MPDFKVIVPAHQAEQTLPHCLAGLKAAGFSPDDIVVVDDGSRDRTADVAMRFGVRVISNPHPLRPARARNRGVVETAADIILFVDADVVLTSDARVLLESHFSDPAVTAVIGAYDARADGGSIISDYRNLLHHYVHHTSPGVSQTFWTGIGSVRRREFLELGGLLAEWEDIEDVEFGLRLTEAGGRIILDPAVQGTHLKVWTPRSMFRTDTEGRAVPWTRLLLSGRVQPDRLNLGLSHRMAAAGVGIALAATVATLAWTPYLIVAAFGLILFLAGSRGFFAVLYRLRGPSFALRALPWHALHYLAALTGYLKVRLSEKPPGRRRSSDAP